MLWPAAGRGYAEPNSDRLILSPMIAGGVLVLPEMTADMAS
jgi:hypothetical protein